MKNRTVKEFRLITPRNTSIVVVVVSSSSTIVNSRKYPVHGINRNVCNDKIN